jgi:ABC-type Fe3+-hydroxamate transport system substrate-binding protein
MKIKHLKLLALALLPVSLLILSACSTSIPVEQRSAVVKSDTSTTFVDTFHATATVTAIDAASRTVKLTLTNGKHITVKCGPEVANFKQIQINDRVKVTATEELAIYLDKGRRMGISGSSSGALTAIGAKPGGVITDTVQETVKITAINPKARQVTFRDRDGLLLTTSVGDHIDLSKAKVGDSVTISHTQGIAVSVTKA